MRRPDPELRRFMLALAFFCGSVALVAAVADAWIHDAIVRLRSDGAPD